MLIIRISQGHMWLISNYNVRIASSSEYRIMPPSPATIISNLSVRSTTDTTSVTRGSIFAWSCIRAIKLTKLTVLVPRVLSDLLSLAVQAKKLAQSGSDLPQPVGAITKTSVSRRAACIASLLTGDDRKQIHCMDGCRE